MTQNQIAYRNMLVNQRNAEINALNAESNRMQAQNAVAETRRRTSEMWIEGVTSTIANVGGLLLGLLL